MRTDTLPVLLIDGDNSELDKYSRQLASEGISNILTFTTGQAAADYLEKHEVGIVILNVNMPDIGGVDLLALMLGFPRVSVIVFTENNDPYMIVDAMRSGVLDYLIKSAEGKHLPTIVRRAIWLRDLQQVNTSLKNKLLEEDASDKRDVFAGIVTQHPKMLAIFRYVEAVARSNMPILLTGETGVGKELFVRAIHAMSGRKKGLVSVNIAGLDDNAFSDTLFGHRKGAFTGADADRKGLIERASDGTLFLDEIGDLFPTAQVKLLRLLQEGEYYPLGQDVPVFSTARVVLATNRDLRKMEEAGLFRRDLYYRLESCEIHIPPLRERREDIPLLVDYFLDIAAKKYGMPKLEIPKELFGILESYHFPGNVRELEGMIMSTARFSRGKILSAEHIKQSILKKSPDAVLPARGKPGTPRPQALPPLGGDRLPTLEEMEVWLIREAMKRTGMNKTKAAELVGITRSALSKRISRDAKLR